MPAGSTYTPIATTTVSNGTTTTVTFSSISGSYTDLVLVGGSLGMTGDGTMRMRLNSAAGTAYSFTSLYGNGSSALSNRDSNRDNIPLNYNTTLAADNNGSVLVHFENYSNTTTNKTVLSRFGRAAAGTEAIVGLWRSTAAITQIDISNQVGGIYFQSGSTFTLYGIASA